jgi:hypothetical protein
MPPPSDRDAPPDEGEPDHREGEAAAPSAASEPPAQTCSTPLATLHSCIPPSPSGRSATAR